MKKFLILTIAVAALSCSLSKEFEARRDYAKAQISAIDTITTFESLLDFHDKLMNETIKYDTMVEFSDGQLIELTALYDSLSAKMERRAMELFPNDSVNVIDEF